MINGSQTTIRSNLTDETTGLPADATGALSLIVITPSGLEKVYNEGEIAHIGTGKYQRAILGNENGLWHYRFIDEHNVVEEGTFEVESVFLPEGPPDLTDLRVLVPKARRACEGPFGPPPNLPTLTDEQIYQMVADACGDVLVLTGSFFGHQLLVKKRDPLVGFPTDWRTEVELTEAEGGVIVAQAAINYIFHLFRETKTNETIKDEGQEWTWQRSANLLVLQVKQLTEARDKAIEMLERMHAPMESWISTVAERDKLAAIYLEPYVAEIGAPVPYAGLSGAYTGGFDFRFGTWG